MCGGDCGCKCSKAGKMGDMLPAAIGAALPAVLYDVWGRGSSFSQALPLAVTAGISSVAARVIGDNIASLGGNSLVRAGVGGAVYYGITSNMNMYPGGQSMLSIAGEGAAYTYISDMIGYKFMNILPNYSATSSPGKSKPLCSW